MEMIKPFIGLALLTWLWTAFTPVQNPIKQIFKGHTLVGLWIRYLLTCWRCLTLWAGLYWFGLDYWFEVLLTCFSVSVIDMILDRWQK